jgi:hypothetical protein
MVILTSPIWGNVGHALTMSRQEFSDVSDLMTNFNLFLKDLIHPPWKLYTTKLFATAFASVQILHLLLTK